MGVIELIRYAFKCCRVIINSQHHAVTEIDISGSLACYDWKYHSDFCIVITLPRVWFRNASSSNNFLPPLRMRYPWYNPTLNKISRVFEKEQHQQQWTTNKQSDVLIHLLKNNVQMKQSPTVLTPGLSSNHMANTMHPIDCHLTLIISVIASQDISPTLRTLEMGGLQHLKKSITKAKMKS